VHIWQGAKEKEENMPLLTDKEVAAIFRVSRTTIWNWVRSNDGFPKAKEV